MFDINQLRNARPQNLQSTGMFRQGPGQGPQPSGFGARFNDGRVGSLSPLSPNPAVPDRQDTADTSYAEGIGDVVPGGAGPVTLSVTLQRDCSVLVLYLDDPSAVITKVTAVSIGSQQMSLGVGGFIPSNQVMEGSAAFPNPPGLYVYRLDGNRITAGTNITVTFLATGAGTASVWGIYRS